MRATVCDALEDVDRAAWDALERPSLYHAYDWLAARAGSVRGSPRFVLVHDGGRLVLGLPCFVTDGASHPRYDPAGVLTQWDPAADPAWLAALRPALVVAAPTLTGGPVEAAGLTEAERARALATAADAVDGIAADEAVATVAWLYLPEGGDAQLDAQLTRRAYRSAVVEAECSLPIAWPSFQGYLDHLKASGRRAVNMERRRLVEAGGRVELGGLEVLGPELAGLEARWREKYGRAAPPAEIERQYALLRHHRLADRTHVFVARREGAAIGFATFFEDRGVWYSRFLGFDYDVDSAAAYFNVLFYAPIEAAIARRIACIRYSFESHDAKRRRGCLLRNVLMYVRGPDALAPRLRDELARLDRERRATLGAIAASHKRSG